MLRILVVAPSWIGDALLAQPLLRRLHEKLGRVAIDALAPTWCAPLLARMPEINEVIESPFAHGELKLRSRWKLGRKLAERRYDQAIVLPNSFKAALIPWLMFRAIRETAVRREVEPFITPVTSMVLGAAGVGAAFALSRSLPLPSGEQHPFLVPTALATVWVGLLLMVSRKKAVSQVLGFLVLENGVFLFGLLLSDVMPLMVEAGVLLDLLAAVFVMGIVMFDIQRELASLDTEKLQRLRD